MPKLKGGARRGSPKGTLFYIQKDILKEECGVHNLVSEERDIKGLTTEFNDLNSGRGRRSYYHEFIAFSPKDRERCTPEFMRDFSEGYIRHNYENQQVFWGVHRQNKGEPVRHVHVHFCISATDLNGKKLHRTMDDMMERDRYSQGYAKEQGLEYFNELNRGVELRRVPSMEKKNRYYDRMDSEGRPIENAKEKLNKEIKGILDGPRLDTKKEFKDRLESKGISLSNRQTGVEYNNRTYRFKGLGYDKDLYLKDIFKNEQINIMEPKVKLKAERDMGLSMSMGM